VELDILPDGSLDLPEEALEGFDIVLVSVHSKLDMPKARMTKRVLKALSYPAVDILAHPTGRLLNKRQPVAIDLEDVFHAAKERDVALEMMPNRSGSISMMCMCIGLANSASKSPSIAMRTASINCASCATASIRRDEAGSRSAMS
jgi:histidinol phosphatase-like PHP family hydrolase